MRLAAAATVTCFLLAACGGGENVRRHPDRGVPLGEAAYDEPPAAADVPPDVTRVPDAVPRPEPRSAWGNAPQYEALGQTYTVLASANGYKKRGKASWYGKRFHGRKTANGEIYDMFAMSAAHKSLPLPSYVRVTRPGTDRSVIVRVNDRGPFIPGRIIDLSYAAAAKLGMIEMGEALVEVEAVVPATDPGWLQLAEYSDPINAVSMREELAALGIENVEIWPDGEAEAASHRLVVGPFPDEPAARTVRDRLLKQGLPSEWVRRSGATAAAR